MNDTSMAARSPAIALSGVNLSLGRGAARVHILKDIDLHIGRGEAVGLVGPSGSGKSTLLMVMAGLERADTGSVLVAGRDLARARRGRAGALPRPQRRHRVPVLPPDPDHDRAGERRGAARTRRRPPTRSSAPREELAAVGLAERLNHYPAQLSGGEQQRVALARALAPNPAILVADEPTGNLDEATGEQIIDLLFTGHVERGTTLILVTHDTALAQRCDRVVRLRSGRIDSVENGSDPTHDANRLPLPLKLVYTAFMAVLVPVYWYYYGPTNFLYFCDVALFLTLAGIWLESPLLVSMCAVGIIVPQMLWVHRFPRTTFRLAAPRHDRLHVQARELAVPARAVAVPRLAAVPAALSGWKLGYDRRALLAWTVLAWVLILVCFFFMPPPQPEPRPDAGQHQLRVGPERQRAQTWVHPTSGCRPDDRHAAAAVPAGASSC